MDLRSVALTLGRRWPVFPVMPNGKKPATRSGVDSATQDLDRISAWWERIPSCNIGIRTGEGLLVVDLDLTDSASGFAELTTYASSIDAPSDWLETFTVHTPRSGLGHLYFRSSARLRNRVGVLPGVDVRSSRGYVVSAYSRIDGKRYLPESHYRETVGLEASGVEYLEEFEPELSEAPEWLVELLAGDRPAVARRVYPEVEIREPGPYLEAVLLGERHRLMLAKPGGRNHALNAAAYRIGRHVAAGRLEYEQAEAWLVATAGEVLDDDLHGERGPLSEAEILATIRSGLDGGSRHA